MQLLNILEFKSHNIWDLNTQEPCELLDKDLVTKSINGMYLHMYVFLYVCIA